MQHSNNFGFLRLLFASLVIVSHSPELIDGNRSREVLTWAFGTISFGELAVDAFFIVSGYLILKSYEQSPTPTYFKNRFLRIYPGYIVCYLTCFLVVGPLVGGDLREQSTFGLFKAAVSALLLMPPVLPGSAAGLPHPALNGSMWTIAYEFRCYLLVAVFGALGLYRQRRALFAVTIILLALYPVFSKLGGGKLDALVGRPDETARLLAMFCTGSVYYVYRNEIQYTFRKGAMAAAGLVVSLFEPTLAHIGVAVFGGYLIFWIALHVSSDRLARINNNDDISYGIYLYAWPFQTLVIFYHRDISPALLVVVTLICVSCVAFVSWRFVERPFLWLKRNKQKAHN